MPRLTDLISEFPALASIRDRLAAADEKISALERENDALRKENAALKAGLVPSPESDFVSASGVLWKRKSSGGYETVPCCPTCKSTLADYSGSLLCLKCNWPAPLKSFEVPRVFHELFGQG